jgi:hypothetical protein
MFSLHYSAVWHYTFHQGLPALMFIVVSEVNLKHT